QQYQHDDTSHRESIPRTRGRGRWSAGLARPTLHLSEPLVEFRQFGLQRRIGSGGALRLGAPLLVRRAVLVVVEEIGMARRRKRIKQAPEHQCVPNAK